MSGSGAKGASDEGLFDAAAIIGNDPPRVARLQRTSAGEPGSDRRKHGSAYRIAIQNQNKDAQILMADPRARERIRLMVDRNGQARIEAPDADGKVTFQAPED